MIVSIEKIKKEEFDIAIQLLKALYMELGEEEESITFLNRKFLNAITATGLTEIYSVKTDRFGTVGIFTVTECQSIYAGGKYGLIDEMFVKPAFRSNKIGAKLIESIKKIGQKKKWKRIDVTGPTEERWIRTIAFYEKSGFVFTGPKMKLIL